MNYQGKVFRPPSEASSLIIQCTIGCSHNKCSFCSMYKEDQFRIRPLNEILADLDSMSIYANVYKRVFLGDGDALIMSMDDLKTILKKISSSFPANKRTGIYASPKSLTTKTVDQLKELKELGLGIIYLGMESGSDLILKKVNKGASAQEILDQAKKVKEAGILLSVTMISGLGGQELSHEHAVESAKLINQMEPHYLGLLTLMQEPGTELDLEIKRGDFLPLTPLQVLEETKLFVCQVEAKGITFRSNHASNYLGLAGILDQDKDKIIATINHYLIDSHPNLRKEAYRSL